jgi:type I restriction-modification system DNA methylase subunit
MSQATQQDIESWLWDSANILRGPVDPANLRDFVFPLLFLKRLSDTWDEEQEKAVQQAVEFECLKAIIQYLTEVADTLDANKIETLNVPTLRAMAQELSNRLPEDAKN